MLTENQINLWISIKQVALALETGDFDSCEGCNFCIFTTPHICINNLDSLPDHAITLKETTWCCQRGPVQKMIDINNTVVDLVMSVKRLPKDASIQWINEVIQRYQ